MSKTFDNKYSPTQVSHPGVTLRETLESLCMSQVELAKRMGRPLKTINEIINGKTWITSETALQLETVLGVPASFWLKRQQQYDESIARTKQKERRSDYIDWLESFPTLYLYKHCNFREESDKLAQIDSLLKFFGVVSPQQWEHQANHLCARYRRSKAFDPQVEPLSVWLRLGELKAQEIPCKQYDESAFKEVLKTIRSFTAEHPDGFDAKMKELCASCGVAYALIPEPPRTGVSGAMRWLHREKVLIQQNLRYKTNDQFWFTFFHEAAHVLLHSSEDIILEFDGNSGKMEDEANRFAADFLIPRSDYDDFVRLGDFSKAAVRSFAKDMKIAAGIVVGRLQYDRHIPFRSLNEFKIRFDWSSD